MISPEKIADPWLVLAWKLSKSGMSLRRFEAVYAPKIDAVADPVIDERDALASELLTLRAERDEAREALKLAKRLNDEALPKFDWGKSALDANAIWLLNEVPLAVDEALRSTLSPEDSKP